MIHDNEKDRRARRASAGNSPRPPLVVGGVNFGSGHDANYQRPARDSDAVEKRVEVLEKRVARMERILSARGFDFEGGAPPVAEASS